MIKLKGRKGALRWILALATMVLLVTGISPLLPAGQARAANDEPTKAWKDITLIYTTDIKGKIEPCG